MILIIGLCISSIIGAYAQSGTANDPDIQRQLKMLQDLRTKMATKVAKPRIVPGCAAPPCIFVSPPKVNNKNVGN